jgi:hypothetical protein
MSDYELQLKFELSDAHKRIAELQSRLDERTNQLRTMLRQPLAPRDHMTSCDRIMGATHTCTCHADEYRALLEKL